MRTLVVVGAVQVLLTIFSDHALPAVEAQVNATSFSFPYFQPQDARLLTSGDVLFNTSTYSCDMTSTQLQKCGRIVYSQMIPMVHKATGASASFSTSFEFSFLSKNDYWGCGNGMAFTFSPRPSLTYRETTDPNRIEYGMCLFDYGDRNVSNNVFAVKFDSRLDAITSMYPWYDPSDSNIGLVTTNSGITSVTHYNYCSYPNNTSCGSFCGPAQTFTAWIDYDSANNHTVEVRFRPGRISGSPRPFIPVISVSGVALHEILDESMYVGFSASTHWFGSSLETHRLLSWNFNSSFPPGPGPGPGPIPSPSPSPSPSPRPSPSPSPSLPPSPKPNKYVLIGGIVGALLGVAVIGALFFWFKHKRKLALSSAQAQTVMKPAQEASTTGLKTDGHARPYTFTELSIMTDNFSDKELLSSGTFADVYKGTPPSGGHPLAVKRLKLNKAHARATFLAEANSLSQIRHRHLLQLRGWCESKNGMFLVYDFMSNGSLDMWLHYDPTHQETGFEGLSWDVRHCILAGVAAGLEYLHEGWLQCVLHRDIKSSNVLLDGDFNAYLGDFGLARLVDHDQQEKTTMVAGTLGYIAPEMYYTGKASKQTDTYAFGILVLEVVCGRRPMLDAQDAPKGGPDSYLLLDRVWRAREEGDIARMIDRKLLGWNDHNEPRDDRSFLSEEASEGVQGAAIVDLAQAITNILHVGLMCCLPNPSERPSMRVVNYWLNQSKQAELMEFPALPRTKPPHGQYVPGPPPSDGTSSSLQSTWSSGVKLSSGEM